LSLRKPFMGAPAAFPMRLFPCKGAVSIV
jgi:hypothetical protein